LNKIVKNQEYIVEIIDNGYQAEGIAKIDDYTVFIPNTIKGEKVRIVIVKANKTYGYGKVLEILEKSKYRVEPQCVAYKRCGGCSMQHISYSKQLEIKKNVVNNVIKKELNKEVPLEDVIGMEEMCGYRNKAKYALGFNKNGENVYGFFAGRTHEIIPSDKCYIQNEVVDEVSRYTFNLLNKYKLPIYNESKQEGLVRHILVKIGIKTNEIMVVFITTDDKFIHQKEIIEELTNKFKNIKSIVQNINNEVTNTILGDKNILLYGDKYITDILGGYKFKISPLSFYQVNPIQTEKLYNKAIEFAELTGNEIVYDLYCGIGTISLFVSKYAKKVYGIEIIEEAIKDAKENAKLNNVSNTEFFAGEVERILPQMHKRGINADVIFVDPPRKGLDATTINTILSIEPEKVVYISCNPATLARDLKMLEEKYEVKKVQPVDMFPNTHHCEVVIVMSLKENS